jgi:hypothetical protein
MHFQFHLSVSRHLLDYDQALNLWLFFLCFLLLSYCLLSFFHFRDGIIDDDLNFGSARFRNGQHLYLKLIDARRSQVIGERDLDFVLSRV